MLFFSRPLICGNAAGSALQCAGLLCVRCEVALFAQGRSFTRYSATCWRASGEAGPNAAASSANDVPRAAGSRCVNCAMTVVSRAGVSGESRDTGTIRAACAALIFARLSPPASGARPVSNCHHKQPQAYKSDCKLAAVPIAMRSGAR